VNGSEQMERTVVHSSEMFAWPYALWLLHGVALFSLNLQNIASIDE